MDVAAWLRELGLERYEPVFREHEIDWDVLPELTDADLEKLGLPLGPRKKLLRAIARTSAESATPSADEMLPSAEPTTSEAERRQLTVVFCDLVGSTELAGRLDPEDMRDVVRAYQNAVAGEIARFEGHVAKFLGDGVLAYFGWPRAHEDEAERAVRAGLAIVEAVGRLEALGGSALSCRVGIATGLVIVGELVGEGAAREEAVVGETPNLAARLQARAEPGQVVISRRTRRLVGELFELDDRGRHELKGFSRPVRAWLVKGESSAESRFEAMHGARIAPLVGREEEIELLLRRFAKAKGGEGQVVLLSGEPGIGKSRLVRALRERLDDESYTPLSYFGSPLYTHSPLHPVIRQLERAAGIVRDDPSAVRLDKLEALLARGGEYAAEAVPLIAELLGLDSGERWSRPPLTPQQQKQRTFKVLLDQLAELVRERPVLITWEDAHCLDPTSLELIDLTVDSAEDLPVLLIVTFRPEFHPPWAGRAHVTQLSLNRLTHQSVGTIVSRVSGGKPLPQEVVEQIIARTDGVPLFVEELTKTVLESDLLREADSHYELAGPPAPLAIPATLHDSLMARLDRLAPVKEVAQICAVIGRDFSHELLSAVAGRPEAELQEALDQLVAAELVFRRGMPPDASYAFKHALVQEAAYTSLLRERRRQLHALIAETLERRAPGEPVDPELLAYHFAEAGMTGKAVSYWLEAAQQAFRRPAIKEAIARAQKGLELIGQVADETEGRRLEAALQNMLGVALHAVSGPVEEVERAYSRARQLSAQLGDERQLYAATYGLWFLSAHRTPFEHAGERAEELLKLAERAGDDSLLLQAHHANWTTWLFHGEPGRAFEHAARGSALYREERDHPLSLHYGGHDAGVCSRYTAALAGWLLGRPEKAVEQARGAVELAERLADPISLSIALTYAAKIRLARGEAELACELADQLCEVTTEHGIAIWREAGAILQGAALAFSGEPRAGITRMTAGLSDLGAMGHRLRRSYFLALLAAAHARAGDEATALDTLDDALSFVEQSGERWWEAEIHRLRGELLRVRDLGAAEKSFRAALDVARAQEASSLELRSAASLAGLWAEHGHNTEAHDLLASVYDGFTEGFETADLKAAENLLKELA